MNKLIVDANAAINMIKSPSAFILITGRIKRKSSTRDQIINCKISKVFPRGHAWMTKALI